MAAQRQRKTLFAKFGSA